LEKAMEYWQLLKSPLWQQKRLEMLTAAGWECQNCGGKQNELQVHHKQYFKGKNPWEYESDQLEVLCSECHSVQHQSIQNIKEIISLSNVNEIYNLLIGYSELFIVERTTEYDEYKNFDAQVQSIGTIAKLLHSVDPKKYRGIAEFLIENCHPHLKDEAENFYRQNFCIEVDEL
jgi:hypothetical protein